ncbi:MAG: transcriptional repressor [Actinomycetota bacterium]|nr:transcriptional repressor [Actinomycetota bacterium]
MTTARSQELLAQLKELTPRVTPQRRVILEAICDLEGHLSAEEIVSEVTRRLPGVSPSTVYRNLQALENVGLISHVHMGHAVAQYQAADHGGHHHLVCGSCGRVQKIDKRTTRNLQRSLLASHGFRADFEHFAIYGTCAECAQETSEG